MSGRPYVSREDAAMYDQIQVGKQLAEDIASALSDSQPVDRLAGMISEDV